MDFINQKNINSNIINQKRDTFKLRNTNFILGEEENPEKAYLSICKDTYKGKSVIDPVKNLKDIKEITTVKISNNQGNDFLTEKQYK
jgi:hypothetical protein